MYKIPTKHIMTDGISSRAVVIRWSVLCVLSALALGALFAPSAVSNKRGELRVTIFDVGQGDAIFIESSTGRQALIDGGPPDGGVLRQLSERMGFFDRSLDFVLATHPDKDHIGGLPDVLARYDVAEIVLTENRGESAAAEAFLAGVETEGAAITYARRGMVFDLGAGALLTILFPDRDPSFLESNTASIVARLTFGESEFLFTGDSPQSIEDYLVILDGGAPSAGWRSGLASDVLKVGHHGSRTSTSEFFLSVVRPEYAVISAGKGNQYGHPHAEVLAALREAGAEIQNTAESGSVTFVSDGARLWVEE